jgi:hypothetical protein
MTVERIVVGDDDDSATVRRESLSPAVANERVLITDLWTTVSGDTFYDGAAEDAPWALTPPLHGSTWRLVEFKPGHAPADVTEGMHSTETVDLGVVLSGAIELVLDNGRTVSLSSGDNLVLRGSRHTWRNTGTQSCVMSFLLVRSSIGAA